MNRSEILERLAKIAAGEMLYTALHGLSAEDVHGLFQTVIEDAETRTPKAFLEDREQQCWICPNCGKVFGTGMFSVRYCSDCGQALRGDSIIDTYGFRQTAMIQKIKAERRRQDAKWGQQDHYPERWIGIHGEEVGEWCEAINETVFDNGSNKGGYDNMMREASHMAAVALAFMECLDKNREAWRL